VSSTFEQGFAEAERAAEQAHRAASRLGTQIKQLQKAAKLGDIAALRRAVERVAAALDALRDDVANAREAWPFSPADEVDYMEAKYIDELRALSRESGLALYERDGNLVCSPSIVRVQAEGRSVRIDRRRVVAIRPSALVEELRANQKKPQRFRSDQFMESLYDAYRLVAGTETTRRVKQASFQGPVIQLERIYQALTLAPGASKEYDRSDFARDLYLLASSNVCQTRSGAQLSLPASTGTKGGRLFSFVAPDGEVVNYYGIRFTEKS
jgi:hypothetical protein